MDIKTSTSPLDEALLKATKDDANMIPNLSTLAESDSDIKCFTIESELPAYPDPDIILGYVQRWREVQRLFGKELRIFAWSYDTRVEKYILACVQNMPNIYITILPAEYRRKERRL